MKWVLGQDGNNYHRNYVSDDQSKQFLFLLSYWWLRARLHCTKWLLSQFFLCRIRFDNLLTCKSTFSLQYEHFINIFTLIDYWIIFFFDWILVSDFIQIQSNNLSWNANGTTGMESRLWMLMSWCNSTRASAPTIIKDTGLHKGGYNNMGLGWYIIAWGYPGCCTWRDHLDILVGQISMCQSLIL